MHARPKAGFYRHFGSYKPRCRERPVPRFQCRVCRRGFSLQTFRADYRDHRPHDNPKLFAMLVSGTSLRQAGRLLEMNVGTLQRKFRKISRWVRLLNRNLLPRLLPNRTLLLDELETFETSGIRPVTVPVVIDRDSRLVVASSAAPIRRVAAKGSKRRRWLERHEAKHGKRRDRSRRCVQLVLRRIEQLRAGEPTTLLTDQKPLYAALVRRLFDRSVTHVTVSGRLLRTTWNPLFPINHTEAMLRDNCGRLHRQSWLVTKRVRFLRMQLHLFIAYRNWVRPRHNHDPLQQAPGVLLKLIARNLTFAELLGWRQDWRRASIHPASHDGQTTCAMARAA